MNNINPNPSSCYTQVKLILDYMRDGNEITSLEAVGKFGCMRLAARIADIRKKLGDGEEYVYLRERSRKHRYFFFIGNKREVQKMRAALPYKPQPYPKGDNKRYDASFEVQVQGYLF